MLKSIKFPFIYILELVILLPLLTGFAITVSFLASKPVASFDLHGKSLPADWEAAIVIHSKFQEGHLIANHPVVFAAGLALLFTSAAVLYPVYKAQISQRESAPPSQRFAHTFAHIIVGAVLVAVGYYVLNHVLVGIAPT